MRWIFDILVLGLVTNMAGVANSQSSGSGNEVLTSTEITAPTSFTESSEKMSGSQTSDETSTAMASTVTTGRISTSLATTIEASSGSTAVVQMANDYSSTFGIGTAEETTIVPETSEKTSTVMASTVTTGRISTSLATNIEASSGSTAAVQMENDYSSTFGIGTAEKTTIVPETSKSGDSATYSPIPEGYTAINADNAPETTTNANPSTLSTLENAFITTVLSNAGTSTYVKDTTLSSLTGGSSAPDGDNAPEITTNANLSTLSTLANAFITTALNNAGTSTYVKYTTPSSLTGGSSAPGRDNAPEITTVVEPATLLSPTEASTTTGAKNATETTTDAGYTISLSSMEGATSARVSNVAEKTTNRELATYSSSTKATTRPVTSAERSSLISGTTSGMRSTTDKSYGMQTQASKSITGSDDETTHLASASQSIAQRSGTSAILAAVTVITTERTNSTTSDSKSTTTSAATRQDVDLGVLLFLVLSYLALLAR